MKNKMLKYILIGAAFGTSCMIATNIVPEVNQVVYAEQSDFEIDSNNSLVKYNGSGTDVVIPDGVLNICSCAFLQNEKIEKVYIPETVIGIDAYAFRDCTNLKEIVFNDGLKEIGYLAFADCTNIKSINLPESVDTIQAWAFSGCTGLEEIRLPQNMITMEGGVFQECSKLQHVTIPNGVSILMYADEGGPFYGIFQNCSNLKAICIPASVEVFESNTFTGCASLTDICFLGTEKEWSSIKKDTYCGLPKETKIHFGHTEEKDKAVAATTTSTGLTEGSHCSVCNTVIKAQEVIPMIKEDKPVVKNPFTDIPDGKWYTDAVLYVQRRGAMTGTTSTTFAPLDNLTRGMTATLLWKLEGSVPYAVNVFPDVKPSSWYGSAVAWAKNNGIVGGYSSGDKSGTFGPKDNITRQDFIKILYQYAQFKGYNTKVKAADSYTKVEDGSLISKYAREAMNWGYENELIANNSLFKPKDNITRRETATIIARFLKAFDPE